MGWTIKGKLWQSRHLVSGTQFIKHVFFSPFMMHFYGALILFVTVSAACGLRCYSCQGKTCSEKETCPVGFDRCSTMEVKGVPTKSCTNSTLCIDPIKCCSTDLCNSATPTGSSVVLLLASSAIITLFL